MAPDEPEGGAPSNEAPSPEPKLPEDIEERIRERERRMERLQARLERAETFEKRERKDKIQRTAKLAAIGIAVAIVLVGGVWGVTKASEYLRGPDCEQVGFHEHATFYVFDEGERLRFLHSRFDAGVMPLRFHLHQPNDYQLHLEGGCTTLGEGFAFMGMDLRSGSLRLDDETHEGKLLQDSDNKTLQFYVFNPDTQAWAEKPDLPDHQGRQGERILITYGELTPDQIAAQQAQIPPPSE